MIADERYEDYPDYSYEDDPADPFWVDSNNWTWDDEEDFWADDEEEDPYFESEQFADDVYESPDEQVAVFNLKESVDVHLKVIEFTYAFDAPVWDILDEVSNYFEKRGFAHADILQMFTSGNDDETLTLTVIYSL